MKKKWIFIGGGAVLLVFIGALIMQGQREKQHEAEIEQVAVMDLTEVVSASGTIDPQRSVDVSANMMGKITKLAVAEGDTVSKGQFLLEIDPTEYLASVRSLEAAYRTAQADLDLAVASSQKAQADLRRAEELFRQGINSEEQVEAARTNAQVEKARVAAARSRLNQREAELERARYDLDKVTVSAPMSGIVTRLNVEEGENAIMGTLNNPGTVLLVIADLSTMEAVVKVDETEVVKVAMGQRAEVEIDAFPDTTFTGKVTEIGNSPIYASTGASQEAVDFEVKITLDNRIPNIRPGLSAKADIEVASRKDALAVPLGAVTVREWPPKKKTPADRKRGRGGSRQSRRAASEDTAAAKGEDVKREEKEGVFVVEDRAASFRPVRLGIAGEEHFEVVSGLQEGESVVAGPFRLLRDLEDGMLVKPKQGRDEGD